MTNTTSTTTRRRAPGAAVALAAMLLLASCSTATDAATSDGLFDESTVHSVSVEFDEADYDALIASYRDDGDKTWIEADVTIDGTEYAQAGLRLKGNSSLFSLGGGPRDLAEGAGPAAIAAECFVAIGGAPAEGGATPAAGNVIVGGPGGDISADEPASLPWLIRLDKYVEDQEHEGISAFVVRSNSSTTALNEALALDLLGEAGLATQQAAAVRFRVNGSDERLRLAIELPDESWSDAAFGPDGTLYKADSTGDYSYRGDDPVAYEEAWEQEAGEEDLTPLIEFLRFVNESTDAEFADELADRLDVESFARYLAIEDLFSNFDDIAGPGNNSYLHVDAATGLVTVVAWDHNLAFSAGPGGGGPIGGGPARGGAFPAGPPPGFDPANLPEGCELPTPPFGAPGDAPPPGIPGADDGDGIAGGPGGGFAGPGRANALVDRFLANESFSALYDAARAELHAQLFESGLAADVLDRWAALIESGAGDLVEPSEIAAQSQTVEQSFLTD